MVLLASAVRDPTAGSTFLSQYGPLIAALIVLSGAMVTLFVNVKRDDTRYRDQREDDYRRDQRIAIADVAVAVHNLQAECELLANDGHWRNHLDSADAAKGELLNKLTVASLLIHSRNLQGVLDDVYRAWEAVDKVLNEIRSCAVSQGEGRRELAHSLNRALDQLADAADVLHTQAFESLRPKAAERSS